MESDDPDHPPDIPTDRFSETRAGEGQPDQDPQEVEEEPVGGVQGKKG